ncbi:helix-turn-helix transcriptional regulator [Duncaniella muris]|uniref:helix-turn-helix transcriptional regulator n=1 Tax=Duncaniella muris TaxID=2094150 RepID=UPI00259CD843|nr:helix-turn-helix transcriptional regulator [Duncaniella muris]
MKMRLHICRLLVLACLSVLTLLSPCVAKADLNDSLSGRLAYLKEHEDDKQAIKDVAFLYLNLGNYEEAKKYGRRLLDMGSSTGDKDFCELYGRIVIGSSMLDEDADECFRQLEEARLIANATGNLDALVSIDNSFGAYYLLGQNDAYTSAAYYYEALEKAKELNDTRRYGIILSNLSGAYLLMKDVSGRRLAEEAHEIAEKRGDPIPLYYAKSALAHFCLLADSLDQAGRLIAEIEDLHRQGEFGGEPNLYLVKGLLADKRGDTRSAYRNYTLAMEHFRESDASEVSATYLAYARLLRRDGHLKSAIEVLEQGLVHARSAEMKVHAPELMKELVYSYRDAGDYRKALDYSLACQALQDSVFTLSRERTLHENRIRHEIYANERLIDEQRMELMATRHRMILLAVCVAAAVALVLLVYFNYRKKDRLYRAIVLQNKEYMAREQMLVERLERAREQEGPQAQASQALADDGGRSRINSLMPSFTSLMIEQKVFCDPAITVGKAAEMLGTNRTYLSKAINESTGKTFTQIVNDYRIREAIAQISDLETDKPLKQICSDVGFSSLSTFYSSFQSITGMTPARYRSQLKEI